MQLFYHLITSTTLVKCHSLFAYHNTSSSSCTGCSVQKRGTFTPATGSTSAFVDPICDCGQFAVLRIATTQTNVRNFFGLSQLQGKIYSIRFETNLRMLF